MHQGETMARITCPHCGKPLVIVKDAREPAGPVPGEERSNEAADVVRDYRDHGVDLLPGGEQQLRPGFTESRPIPGHLRRRLEAHRNAVEELLRTRAAPALAEVRS